MAILAQSPMSAAELYAERIRARYNVPSSFEILTDDEYKTIYSVAEKVLPPDKLKQWLVDQTPKSC